MFQRPSSEDELLDGIISLNKYVSTMLQIFFISIPTMFKFLVHLN